MLSSSSSSSCDYNTFSGGQYGTSSHNIASINSKSVLNQTTFPPIHQSQASWLQAQKQQLKDNGDEPEPD